MTLPELKVSYVDLSTLSLASGDYRRGLAHTYGLVKLSDTNVAALVCTRTFFAPVPTSMLLVISPIYRQPAQLTYEVAGRPAVLTAEQKASLAAAMTVCAGSSIGPFPAEPKLGSPAAVAVAAETIRRLS